MTRQTVVITRTSITYAIFAYCPEDGKLLTLIQQRAQWDAEKQMPQSFRGAWQPAAHGMTESIQETLRRETTEELGNKFAQHLEKIAPVPLENLVEGEEIALHCVGQVPYETLQNVVLHNSASASLLITEEQAREIQTLISDHRSNGVDPQGPIFMFPDDKETLLRGFAHFQNA